MKKRQAGPTMTVCTAPQGSKHGRCSVQESRPYYRFALGEKGPVSLRREKMPPVTAGQGGHDFGLGHAATKMSHFGAGPRLVEAVGVDTPNRGRGFSPTRRRADPRPTPFAKHAPLWSSADPTVSDDIQLTNVPGRGAEQGRKKADRDARSRADLPGAGNSPCEKNPPSGRAEAVNGDSWRNPVDHLTV